MEYYSAIQKNEIMPFAETWMELGLIMFSEESQTKKDNYHMILRMCFSSSHVWMWELDYKESRELKNWYFWTVVLEKTLESPLDPTSPS